jgi:alpha-1,3-rhamnosyl/mannosyltransferase
MRWLLFGARRELLRELLREPQALVHCVAYVCPWRLPLPFVVTVPDALGRFHPADSPLEWRLYERWLLPGRVRAAARVITETEFAKNQVATVYGADPERIAVTSRGIDERFFSVQRPPRGAPPVLLFPGAPIGRKNLAIVLRALAAASPGSALSEACLRISGAGADRFPAHARSIHELGLESRVSWLGRVPDEEMPALYASADAVVYPSLGEGFGVPPLEGMATGTPVVAARAGSLPEVLGDAALLVDPTDARALADGIEAVLSREDVRRRLVDAGRRHARRYTWERCAERTLQVYRAALEAGP